MTSSWGLIHLSSSCQESEQSLLGRMIDTMLRTQDTGLKAQVGEVLRSLLDSSSMELNPVRDEFLNIFYDKYMDGLLSPFLHEDKWGPDGTPVVDAASGAPGDADAAVDGGLAESSDAAERRACWDCARCHIIDLLSFAVQHHSHRIKYYIMRHNGESEA